MAPIRTPAVSLAGQIDDLQAAMSANVSPDAVWQYALAIQELVDTGVAGRALSSGAAAPDFSLPDQNGQLVSLTALLEKGPAVVTFYRGAWCPYCDLTLRAYERILPEIAARGASLVAISPQTPDSSLTTAESKHLTFSVLSDVRNAAARAYGLVFVVPQPLRHPGITAANGDESWELPVPGTFVIAPDGVIRLGFAQADYTRRLEPDAILDALERIAS